MRSLWGSRGPFSHVREWPPLFALPARPQGIPSHPLRCDNMNPRRVHLIPRPKARVILHRHVGALAVVRDHGVQDVCLFVHADPAATVARQRKPLRACDLRDAGCAVRLLFQPVAHADRRQKCLVPLDPDRGEVRALRAVALRPVGERGLLRAALARARHLTLAALAGDRRNDRHAVGRKGEAADLLAARKICLLYTSDAADE